LIGVKCCGGAAITPGRARGMLPRGLEPKGSASDGSHPL
jgi:hypothetical protein